METVKNNTNKNQPQVIDAPELPPKLMGQICPLMSNGLAYQECGPFCKWYCKNKRRGYECLIKNEIASMSYKLKEINERR